MDDGCCANEITELKGEIEKYSREVKTLKDEYKILLIQNIEKDLKIRELKNKIKSKKYIHFEKVLSKTCTDKLKLIDDAESEDTKFVDVILNELYNVETLKCKSISGRSKNKEKSAITPEKKLLLEEIYKERLQHLSPSTANIRKKNLSKIIRNTIDVANRKKTSSIQT